MAAAEAYLRGIERRIEAGLDPKVGSVASLLISRWDKGSADQLPDELHNRLGIAVGQQTYRSYREMLPSERWRSDAHTSELQSLMRNSYAVSCSRQQLYQHSHT